MQSEAFFYSEQFFGLLKHEPAKSQVNPGVDLYKGQADCDKLAQVAVALAIHPNPLVMQEDPHDLHKISVL